MKEVCDYINIELRAYAICLTGNKNDAMDLIQDTCLRMLLAKNRYQEKSVADQKKIAITIMRNRFLDLRRKSQQTKCLEYYDVFESYVPADGQLSAKTINRFMDTSKKKAVEAFRLFYQGRSIRELSDHFGVGINTALGLVRYGRKNIIKGLQLER